QVGVGRVIHKIEGIVLPIREEFEQDRKRLATPLGTRHVDGRRQTDAVRHGQPTILYRELVSGPRARCVAHGDTTLRFASAPWRRSWEGWERSLVGRALAVRDPAQAAVGRGPVDVFEEGGHVLG